MVINARNLRVLLQSQQRAQVARLHFFSGRKLCVWQSETQTHLKSSNNLTLGALNKLLLDCSHHPEAVARWRWASHQPEELVNHSWMESHELVIKKLWNVICIAQWREEE